MSPKQNAFQKGHQMKASWDVSYVSQVFPLKVPFVTLTVAAVVSLGPHALSAKSQTGLTGNHLSPKLFRKRSVWGFKKPQCADPQALQGTARRGHTAHSPARLWDGHLSPLHPHR